jgi:predicted DNA-binding transcriptional regulator YafY
MRSIYNGSQSRLSRTVSIISIMLRGAAKIEVEKWAERFGVDQRTIYRDLSYLRARLPELFRRAA